MNQRTVEKYLYKGLIVVGPSYAFNLTLSNLAKHLRRMAITVIRLRKPVKIYLNKNNKGTFRGDIIYKRSWDNQLIIIDNRNKNVYRKYTSEEQYDRVNKGKETLEILYNIIDITFPDKLTAKEEYFKGDVLFKSTKSKQIEILEQIIHKYNDALSNKQYPKYPCKISIDNLLKHIESSIYPDEMKVYLNDNKEEVTQILNTLDWTWSHCDLTHLNILYNNSQYKIIDSELCEIMPVFYDIANLMNRLTIVCKNEFVYQNYFSGKYDFMLKTVLKTDKIKSENRRLLLVVMIAIKSAVQWDPENKNGNTALMNSRWNVLKEHILN